MNETMKKNNAHITKATQGKVTMSNFASLNSTGENFFPAACGQRESVIFASLINEDSVQMMKIPTGKNLLPAPLSKIKQCIFAS